MDPSRPVIEVEKDCDPDGRKIVSKHRALPVNKGPDASNYALCTMGPHWVERHLVRCGVCQSCANADVEFVETNTLKRKYNTALYD